MGQFCKRPFSQALRPLDPGQGNATCAGGEYALVLGTNALLLGCGSFFSQTSNGKGFQRDDNFPWLEYMSFFKGVFFRV